MERTRNSRERAELEAELHGGPECPPAAYYLWGWFHELHRARGGGMGPAPIGFGDIATWAALRGFTLAGWEVETLRDLDTCWLAAQAEKAA